jgi:hypothetical protein
MLEKRNLFICNAYLEIFPAICRNPDIFCNDGKFNVRPESAWISISWAVDKSENEIDVRFEALKMFIALIDVRSRTSIDVSEGTGRYDPSGPFCMPIPSLIDVMLERKKDPV